jgi:16S rRNA A1518/A1519 N6-dimethyltransferase RsmA/KsgA/DIM1 with predicted DNA glycosylase/AP lyase activity
VRIIIARHANRKTMTPEAQALYEELQAFVEKMRGDKDYRYKTLGLKEFIEIKSKYSSETWDELQENLNHKEK